MIKIIVSNKIYFKPPAELVTLLERNYTFQIYEHPAQKYPKIIRQISKISDDVYCIERGAISFILEWLDNNNFEYTVIDRTAAIAAELPDLILPPRAIDQAPIIDEYCGDSIIEAAPGFGKTATALGIAAKLKQRTLIICTTTAIRDNWVGEVRKFLGIEAGVLGSGSKSSDAPIVVGNFQTVSKLSNELAKEFGLIIIDEMHHTPAASFTKILTSSHAKYRLGLSGTLKRKDGLQIVFPGLFGGKIFQPAINNVISPVVLRVKCDYELSGNPSIPWANKITALYNEPSYKLMVAMIIQALESVGHKILVTADRVEFLTDMHDSVKDYSSRLFIGEVPTEVRDQYLKDVVSGKANKVFASTGLFSEGISCNPLSALIHTGSTNNESMVYQLIGRIQRILDGKLTPVVVDICLSGAMGKKHARERKSFYLVKGWKVLDIDFQSLDYELKLLLQ